ncbi:hypothetical protein [Nonomuraea sp. NPDC049625]|uniref:hypothetical protein n=1 Tax=Nonomuraea sp. NPDC049625 TaxID=3155775 RepID=UPI00343928B1
MSYDDAPPEPVGAIDDDRLRLIFTCDDLRAVPGKDDRDVAGCAVLGDMGQAGHVAGQQFPAERPVQNLGYLVRLHGRFS